MDFFLLLHNTILVSTTAITLFAVFFAYKKSSETLLIAIAFLFGFCFLDNFIISMTETSPFFSLINNNLMNEAYSYKTIILLATDACYLAINSLILYGKLKQNHFLWVLVHGLFVGITPFFARGALSFWLYWTIPQAFFIGICLYALFVLHKSKKNILVTALTKYRNLLFALIAFNIVIIIEDTFVIFNIDNYDLNTGNVFNRNVSEVFMTIFIALVFIYCFLRRPWDEKEIFPTLPLIKKVIPQPLPENQDKTILTAFDRFCINHTFTDREIELFRYMMEKKTNTVISEKLFISIGTVKTHTHHIYQKVGVAKRTQLINKFNKFATEYETLNPTL